MANNIWDREIYNPREKPLSSDLGRMQSQFDRTLRETLRLMWAGALLPTTQGGDVGTFKSGFVGSSFKVVPSSPASMNIGINSGLGFQLDSATSTSSVGGIVGMDDLSTAKPLPLTAGQVIAVPTADAANARIDIVEVAYDRIVGNSNIRNVLNLLTGEFVPTAVNKTLSWTMDGDTAVVSAATTSTAAISYRYGVPGATPAVPATTAGYIKVAEILVPALAASITYAEIKDTRRLLFPGNVGRAGVSFLHTHGAVAPSQVELVTPTGVAASVYMPANSPSGSVFFFAGDLQSGGDAHAIATGSIDAIGELQCSASIVNISAAEAAFLAGAQASPILLIPSLNGTAGTGHTAIRVDYTVNDSAGAVIIATNTATVSIDVSWRYR